MVTRPTTDRYDDIVVETITLPVRDGLTSAVLCWPLAGGPHPAVAIGAEGTGINSFIRRLGATLAHLGYVVIVPDYYRGAGPPDPEAYDDFDTLMSHINALDFGRAVHDLLDAIEFLHARDDVDGSRVASWGYCTGGTLALFAACLRPDLAAAVLFYPSQPRFDMLDAKKPVHVVDLLWNIPCPVLFIVGDQDVVYPPEQLTDVRRRFEEWGVNATIAEYPGAGHAFNAHGSSLYHQEADERSWEDAASFLAAHLGGSAP
jgi:carboxymethylenebutenolidase